MCRNIFNFGFCSVKRKLRISPDEIFRLVLETKIFKSFPVLLYSLLKACTCNLEYLTSEGKIPRSLKEVSMRFRKKICRKNLRQGPRISGESTRCQNRNWRQGWRSKKLRKPSNFVPITWSIWQGPRISGEIEFSTFDNSANRPVRYFSCWNRLSERREWINWNRWPMVYILRKIPLCKSGSGSLFTFPSPP